MANNNHTVASVRKMHEEVLRANPGLPRRFGADLERAERSARMMVGQLPAGAPKLPSADSWQALGRGLLIGDEPADRVVAWMKSGDLRQAWAQVEHAIEHGIDAIEDAPEALRDFFALVERRPAWVNDELLREGAQVCAMGGLAAMRALLVAGLLAGYQLAALNQTLLATGALSKGAARRIAETTKWWIDATAAGGMERFSDGFKSTLRVRLIHALVRHQVLRKPGWNHEDLGLPVNQTDMQATYFGFSSVYLLGMKIVGVPLSAKDKEAVMHLWRYIAWVNGVQESYLHELGAGHSSGLSMLYHNLLSQRMHDGDSARLGTALIEESLSRNYRRFKWLQGQYNRALHLSIARVCLGNDSLRGLGLSPWQLPWYPLLRAPSNLVLHTLVRMLPGGRGWLARRGRKQQVGILETLFGTRDHQLRQVEEVRLEAKS